MVTLKVSAKTLKRLRLGINVHVRQAAQAGNLILLRCGERVNVMNAKGDAAVAKVVCVESRLCDWQGALAGYELRAELPQ